jgi:hypothetical protein
MSTNYYYHISETDVVENTKLAIHICKFSCGWKILARMYSYRGISSLDDWLLILRAGHGTIVTDYDAVVSFDDFHKKVIDWPLHLWPSCLETELRVHTDIACVQLHNCDVTDVDFS